MRLLAVTENVTLDGFDPQGAGVDMGDVLEENRPRRLRADAVLLGRKTFESFRKFRPKQTDDTTRITDYLNRVQKYVVSSTLTDPQWENSTVLSGDPVDAVTELKRRDGKEIVLTGSISLVHALVDAGLVDEYRLFVYPAVQGVAGDSSRTEWRSRASSCSTRRASGAGSPFSATRRREQCRDLTRKQRCGGSYRARSAATNLFAHE